MDTQKTKIRIGLVCVAFLAATVVLIMLSGGGKFRVFHSDYEIYVLMKQAPMLNENSPVYKNGVEIGRVTRVELVNNDREVKITVRIRSNVKLYTDEECNLSLNLLGQSTLNFTPQITEPLPGEPEPTVLEPKSTIAGVKPIDLGQLADSLQSDATKALHSMSNVADKVSTSFGIINQILGTPEEVALKQKRLEEMINRAAETMTAINRVLVGVDKLINDPDIQNGIRASSTELPGVIDEGRKLMANINGMTDSIATMLRQVDGTIGKIDQNLDNFTQFTESLGENGPQFLEALVSAADEFDKSMAQLYEFARSLNNPDGSFGQLLNDPEFFQMLKSTVKKAEQTSKNIERITVQLQPILQDVNVFANKLARQPGLLGLQGLFDKSPPTKGIPDAYSYPWQYGRNNGIPHQQSERIQLFRPQSWPLGLPQYRNEPVLQQNRYASQVIDLPDSPYYDGGYYDDFAPIGMYDEPPQPESVVYPLGMGAALPRPATGMGAALLRPATSDQVPQIAPPNRVVIIPVQTERLQASGVRSQELASRNGSNISPEARNTLTLEIDFTPEPAFVPPAQQHVPPAQQHGPVRLASGNTSPAPPIIQPFHGKTETEQTAPQVVQTSGTIPAKPVGHSEFHLPSFAPVY